MEHKDDPEDILGSVFLRLRLADRGRGQCFTPMHICELMAELAHIPECVKEKENESVKVNEPACGSGAMAYIQFCLYGIPAVVLQGNSLTGEVNSSWYTAQGINVLMKEEQERIEADEERKAKVLSIMRKTRIC